MPTWLETVEQEIEREIPRNRPVQRTRIKTKSDSASFPLFVLMVLLVVALFAAIASKRQSSYSVAIGPEYSSQWPSQEPQGLEEIHTIQEKIWERTKWNTDIITLISIVNNHNLAVAQNNCPRDQYIYLNEDWTIDRLPNHVELSSDDRAFLERFVRN